jgi:hypothetical protein
MVDERERFYPRSEHRAPADTPSTPNSPRRQPVVWRSGFALGLAMLAGTGCRTDVGRATFCHSLLIDGQPAVLQLVQEDQTFTAKTGECSPCGEFRVNDTFNLEVRDPAGNLIAKRFIYLPPNVLTYLLSARTNADGIPQLDVRSYGSDVSCKQIRATVTGGTPALRAEDGEEDEGASLFAPAAPNETSSSP